VPNRDLEEGVCRNTGRRDADGLLGEVALTLTLSNLLLVSCLIKREVRHSIHLSILFEQGSHINVCPQGRTTGGLSRRLKAFMQMTQWKENGAEVIVIEVDYTVSLAERVRIVHRSFVAGNSRLLNEDSFRSDSMKLYCNAERYWECIQGV